MIPGILHFIFITEQGQAARSLSLSHYIAVKSAIAVNNPEVAYFHYNTEPAGEWWQRIRELVTCREVEAPDKFLGRPIIHVAHKSDVIRLQALRDFGGIYLDLDTICVKPFSDLFHHHFVMGREMKLPYRPKNARQRIKLAIRKRLGLAGKLLHPEPGLCNAVLLSEKNSEFVNHWLAEYKTFRSQGRDKYWNEHSGKVSLRLAKEHPEWITLLGPKAFHYPLYDPDSQRSMFEEVTEFPESYVHHLWESFSWEPYLSKLTVEDIRSRDTTFNLLARRYV